MTMSFKESGLLLDISRRAYPPEAIKAFISYIKDAGGRYLQLHFSDSENYAVESELLGQQPAKGSPEENGLYLNSVTGKYFLSKAQLAEIVTHAAAEGIELIPELGSPGHMGGIFALYGAKYGSAALDNGFKNAYSELRYTTPAAIEFVQNLYAEVIGMFPGIKRFHIGGDEHGAAYNDAYNAEFVGYANKQAAFLKARGLIPRMWNDGVMVSTIADLDKSIEITFWAWDGDNPAERERLTSIRAGMDEIVKAGFKVYNCNSYYTYSVPRGADRISGDANYAAIDGYANWDLSKWDGNRAIPDNRKVNPRDVAGSTMSIWGELLDGSQTWTEILEALKPHISAVFYLTDLQNLKDDNMTRMFTRHQKPSENIVPSAIYATGDTTGVTLHIADKEGTKLIPVSGSGGKDGKDGADGADGKSAYQVAVDNGFKGTELEWLESLKAAGGNTDALLKSIYNPLNLNYTQQQLATAFTTSLNELIQKVSLSGGGTVSIPDGQFLVDVTVGITLLDNIELRFGKNTILKALAHNSPQHEILRIHDVNNVTISGGGMIDGSKSQNSATMGEWGMGVSIRGADNIHISDLKVKDTWGDGFYIGRTTNRAFSSRVTLDRVSSDSSRRNGLSVISVKELDVNDSVFDNSFTVEPKCGVDIEPNYADEFIQGVRFKNIKTSGNNIGINVFLLPLVGTNAFVTVDVNGWTDRNSKRESFANRNYLPDSSGYISINGFTAINEEQSTGSMLALYSIAKTGMAFRLKNIALASKITNIDNPYVRIGRFDTAASNEIMGNIEIDGISAKTLNDTLPTNAIILSALPATSKLEGVTIRNIGRLDAVNPIRAAHRVSDVTLKSENRNFYRPLNASNLTVDTNNLSPLYIRDPNASISARIAPDLPSGFEFEIRNAIAGSLDINVSQITLVSSQLGGIGPLRCSVVGGFIKLKSLGGGLVEYISSYGYVQDGATATTAQATVSIPANSQMFLKSINLAGSTTSNPVAVSYSAHTTGLHIWAACEVNGSVNVYAVNHTATAISLPAGTIRVNRFRQYYE